MHSNKVLAIVFFALAAVILALGTTQIVMFAPPQFVMLSAAPAQGATDDQISTYLWQTLWPQILTYVIVTLGFASALAAAACILLRLDGKTDKAGQDEDDMDAEDEEDTEYDEDGEPWRRDDWPQPPANYRPPQPPTAPKAPAPRPHGPLDGLDQLAGLDRMAARQAGFDAGSSVRAEKKHSDKHDKHDKKHSDKAEKHDRKPAEAAAAEDTGHGTIEGD